MSPDVGKFVVPDTLDQEKGLDINSRRAQSGKNPYLEGFSKKKNPDEAEGRGKPRKF